MPGVEAAVNAVNRVIALLKKILRRTFTAVAVITHHQHGGVEIMLAHKRPQRVIRQMKRLRGMTHRIALRIADIH